MPPSASNPARSARVRQARRAGQLPDDARCSRCGEHNPVALVAGSNPLLCYGCNAHKLGKSATEAHHVAGRANSPLTVTIPANDHRVLSDLQNDAPEETMRNPDGNPLLKAAACLRDWLNVLKVIIDRSVGRIPSALEKLNDGLRTVAGERWWERPEFAGFVLAVAGV